MRLTVTFDYPDHLIERFGEQDAAATVAARLEEVYPGHEGEVLVLGTGAVAADPVNSDVRELSGPPLVISVGAGSWLAGPGGLEHLPEIGQLADGPTVVDGDVTYTPWTDGRALGWRAARAGREPEYVLLNPSDRGGDPDDHATVFLYWGRGGSADVDASITHLEVHRD